jgi:TM2 domain-containing membrane protein YozV
MVRSERSVVLAYALWFAGFFFISGLHRFYMGRWVSGLLWLFTGGLCGVGQLIDLFFVPRMLADANAGRDVW